MEGIKNNLNRVSRDGVLIKYKFSPDEINTFYRRSVLTIEDVLGKVGGINAALSGAGLGFSAIFNHKLFMSSLIGRLFHFRPKF